MTCIRNETWRIDKKNNIDPINEDLIFLNKLQVCFDWVWYWTENEYMMHKYLIKVFGSTKMDNAVSLI
jgi:hypothetical protein